MGWRRVADILMGMQARDVVVKASYAKALREEGEAVKSDGRTELDKRYRDIQDKCRQYPKLEEERQAFLRAYPVMKNVEFQQKMGVLPTPVLRGYLAMFYYHISKVKLEEAKEAVKVPIPDIPAVKIPTLPLPKIGGDIKKSVQVTGLVIMAFVALLVYLMFVKGRGASGVTVVG